MIIKVVYGLGCHILHHKNKINTWLKWLVMIEVIFDCEYHLWFKWYIIRLFPNYMVLSCFKAWSSRTRSRAQYVGFNYMAQKLRSCPQHPPTFIISKHTFKVELTIKLMHFLSNYCSNNKHNCGQWWTQRSAYDLAGSSIAMSHLVAILYSLRSAFKAGNSIGRILLWIQ